MDVTNYIYKTYPSISHVHIWGPVIDKLLCSLLGTLHGYEFVTNTTNIDESNRIFANLQY